VTWSLHECRLTGVPFLPMRQLVANISTMFVILSAGKAKLMPRIAAQIEDEHVIKLAMFGSDQQPNWTRNQNKSDPYQVDAGVYTNGMAMLNFLQPHRPSLRAKLLDPAFMNGALLRRIIEVSEFKTSAVVLIRSLVSLPRGFEALQAVGASDYDVEYCFSPELDEGVAKFHRDAAALRRCLACGKSEHELQAKVGSCKSCRAAAYCSRECQQADWPTHKALCKALSKVRQ
jgi:hypothetical protein